MKHYDLIAHLDRRCERKRQSEAELARITGQSIAALDADTTAADSVLEDYACPGCSERRMDRLAWIDDDQVRCESCGEVYRP